MNPPDPRALKTRMGALKDARPLLLGRPAASMAALLGSVGERFLDPDDPLRGEALARIPEEAGLSQDMAVRVLDGMARDWTANRLVALLRAEFPDTGVLDRFISQRARFGEDSAAASFSLVRALGDGVALHVGAGSVPGVCATSLIRSLLVKTPLLVKPGAGDRALTELFHRGLAEADPQVGEAVEVVYWPGDGGELLDAALASADRVVVYGSDTTARSVRDRTPVHVPVVAYHHRSSVAVVGAEALAPDSLHQTAADLAFAVSTFDQRGCVSPHRAWIIGTRADAERLAEATALAMARESEVAPPGPRSTAESARVHQVRGSVELRAAAGEGVASWRDAGTGWTVILEDHGVLEAAGTPRTLIMTWATSPSDVVSALAGDGPHLQSVGLAGLGAAESGLVEALARIGASRMVPLRDIPFPAAWWLHDGKGPLRALVRWAEWTR